MDTRRERVAQGGRHHHDHGDRDGVRRAEPGDDQRRGRAAHRRSAAHQWRKCPSTALTRRQLRRPGPDIRTRQSERRTAVRVP